MRIQGIYEYVIGSGRREETLCYWAELGYQPVAQGKLTEGEALELYGVNSGLTSLRLQNGQVNTHGMIRLFLWDKLPDPGLEFARPLTVGSRWLTSRTADIVRLRDAYMDDIKAGTGWVVSELVRQVIRQGQEGSNFYAHFAGVREMMVLGQETRQVYFQRYGYDVPGYGTIVGDSPLAVSEATHGGIAIPSLTFLNFYTEAMGLKLEGQIDNPAAQPNARPEITFAGNSEAIGPLMRVKGETFQHATLVTPEVNVGRLYLVVPQDSTLDLRSRSRPGVNGLCLFTYRVSHIAVYHKRVLLNGATNVSEIRPNEFGEHSFTFTAPDGIVWNLVS
jgi:catechol 2,3-dioxygenase-like lactoylglutathione lyase family enzyme